tara:strand:- start:1212 stop:1382 length:171 start_codon:yes stop_codon:yes gene_type:complete
MNLWTKISSFFNPNAYDSIRTRDKKGRYIGDDPKTIRNEAYTKVKKKKVKKYGRKY